MTPKRSHHHHHHHHKVVQFDPYPLAPVYRLIQPGPVLLMTTGSLRDATHNVMTIGFHMMMQHESPPLIGITLGPWNHAPADQVEPPLIAAPHILANIECGVEDTTLVFKYAMWVLRPVKAWTKRGLHQPGTVFHHRGQGVMVADGEVIDLSQRMIKWQEFLD
ncbi:hypothetical protein BP00DRAFT_463681 [Aspergillus indologenus CBS 114.80]|uniref:Flavin reductase like domain-containing protein n=1 Tax=Aspergillus indologenus CBS 114.80 TaxID=1450541 RepID=A0A2V5HSL1_9EURO|nr:hypothetical protein BP00DRAFT_463681 [Aspergillus indologenus CBS 114.80]